MDPLDGFRNNTYSQFGENGVIEEALRRISTKVDLDEWCCEFGAWDGVVFSNTANLVKNKGYKAVLIEGESRRVRDLQRNYPESRVVKICSFVTPSGETTLDQILSQTEIPKDFDFLSIDIDGLD